MSDVNQKKTAESLSQNEKVDFLKAMFSTLEIDQKMIFTDWCKDQVLSGSRELLGEKMQEVNDRLNNFIATAYDKITRGAKTIYDKGNEAFDANKDGIPKNNSAPKDDGKPSFF